MSERNAASSSKSKPTIYEQKIGGKRRNSSVKFPPSAEQNTSETSNSIAEKDKRSTSSIRGTSSSSKVENMPQNSSNDTIKSTPTNSPSTTMPIVIFVIPIVYVLLNTPMYTIRFITDGIRVNLMEFGINNNYY
jgi:cobalamin biosynthesis Mg chelatase CobN